MKKIIILLLMLALSFVEVQAKDYSAYCSTKTASKTFSGTLSSLTGVNSIKRGVIESQIEKALKRETGAKFDVKASNFYGVSATSGLFKSLELAGSNLNYDGLYVTNLEAKTICPYNEVLYENNNLKFVENSVMEFTAEISEADLNKTITNSKYGKMVQKLNSDSAISSIMKINSHNIKINGDKLIYNYEVSFLPKSGNILSHLPIKLSNINLAFSSGLAIQDGKVQLLDFGLNNNNLNYGFLVPLLNKFNPTSWGIDAGDDFIKNAQLDINELKIKNQKIVLKGALIAKAEN